MPLPRPILYLPAGHITRAYRYICSAVAAGGKETQQIRRRVGKVCIHLEKIVVIALQPPTKPGNISRTKAEFPRSFEEVKTSCKLVGLQIANDLRGAVRRTIVHNQDVEWFGQGKHGTHNGLHVFPLVVSRDDDD